MKQIDIILVLIVIAGTVLLTYTYVQDRPPLLVLSKVDGTVEVVGVSGNDKCTIQITGAVKNDGDINAVNSRITCSVKGGYNKIVGIGATDAGEIAPHKTKDFSINAHLYECPLSGVELSCTTMCDGCPK